LDEVDDTSIFKTGPLASLSTISDLVNALQPSLTSTIAKRFSAMAQGRSHGRPPWCPVAAGLCLSFQPSAIWIVTVPGETMASSARAGDATEFALE
jgi:hypothetical protein